MTRKCLRNKFAPPNATVEHSIAFSLLSIYYGLQTVLYVKWGKFSITTTYSGRVAVHCHQSQFMRGRKEPFIMVAYGDTHTISVHAIEWALIHHVLYRTVSLFSRPLAHNLTLSLFLRNSSDAPCSCCCLSDIVAVTISFSLCALCHITSRHQTFASNLLPLIPVVCLCVAETNPNKPLQFIRFVHKHIETQR